MESADARPALNGFGQAIDRALRQRLRSNSLTGRLRGHENEVRQVAAIRLFQKQLSGNKKLMRATRDGNVPEIENQINRSIGAALIYARKDVCRELDRHEKRRAPMPMKEVECGVCTHPSSRSLVDLASTEQREMALTMLTAAVKEKLVSTKSAAMAHAMLTDGLTQAEVATRMKISRQAVNQHIGPVCQVLKKKVATQELPTLE